MRVARVAASIVMVATLWCVLGAARSMLAPHCATFPCFDVRFVSASSSTFAGLLALAALWPAPALERNALVLAPLPLVGLIPVGYYLALFQLVNVRCGIAGDLVSDVPCAHPNWWLAPGLFVAILATLVLLRSAMPALEGPRDEVAGLGRTVLVAAGATMLVFAGALAGVGRLAGGGVPDAMPLAIVGALALVGAAAWALLAGGSLRQKQ